MWNKISNSKAFYMVLAIICAVGCWLYVDIVEAPDKSTTIYNIPVTFIGEDTLASEGLMITEGKDATVTLTLTGSRSVISQITDQSDVLISVQAANQISGEGSYNLTYSIDFPGKSRSNINVERNTPSSIDVTVVQMTSKTVDIRGRFTGSVVEGAIFNESEFRFGVPNVTVSGERSLVEQVDHAEVVLDENDLSTTWSGELELKLVDKDGNELDMTNLTSDVTSVYTTFPIQVVKEVPLEVSYLAGGGATEENVTTQVITPPTVTLTGTTEQLSKIDSINLGSIDLSLIVTSDIVNFEIPLPDGVTCISGTTTASVRVVLSGLTTRVVETANIQYINKPEGIDLAPVTENITVRIRGTEEVMSKVLDQDVYVIVDLSDLDASGDIATGTRTLSAKVGVRGFADVGAVGDYQVIANISKS